MLYQEFAPAPPLRDRIASYWRFSLDRAHQPAAIEHAVPPDGAVSLCWLPPERTVIVGPRLAALHVTVYAGHQYLGVRFLPGAAGPFLALDAKALRNAVAPFEHPAFAETMRARGIEGLDELFLKARAPAPDPVVAELAHRILRANGAVAVTALTAGLGLSYRQVLRRFFEATGLTPKEFARIRRMRATCLQAVEQADPAWAGLSAEAGFADQSHLVREFHDVFGWPPRLVHEYLRRIEHRDVTP